MNIPEIKKVEAVDLYYIKLYYDNDEIKIFNVGPYIEGTWFGKLKDVDYFFSVKTNEDKKGISWPDGQDIAPHELYENSISYEKAKEMVLEWDPDFTKVTPLEAYRLKEAENDEYISEEDIDWDNL